MKRKLFVLFGLILSLSSIRMFGQKKDTLYITKEGTVVNKSKAQYKRVFEKVADNSYGYIVTDYYMSNEIFMTAENKVGNRLFFDGRCTYYFQNGKQQCAGNFQNNRQIGIWTYWSENGKDSTVTEFDISGKQKIISNTLTKSNSSSKPVIIDTIVLSDEIDAEFPGGTNGMSIFLKQNLRYPSIARERSLGGRTIIYFEIDKEGHIVNIIPKTLLGFEMEEEATRVIRAMPKWSPAYQNGKAVRVRRTIPLSFTLP